MKDLFLIPILLATFAFCYYVVAKFGDFIDENQRLIAEGNRNRQCQIRIAAENPILLDSIALALENCCEADPYLEFFLSSGKGSHLLAKLADEQIDILLLTEEHTRQLEQQFASIFIPYEKTPSVPSTIGLPIENLYEDVRIGVAWKKSQCSKNRDRVIFALENEYCRLKCGYADYMN